MNSVVPKISKYEIGTSWLFKVLEVYRLEAYHPGYKSRAYINSNHGTIIRTGITCKKIPL